MSEGIQYPKNIIYQEIYHWEDMPDIGEDIYNALESGEFKDEFKGKIVVTLEHFPEVPVLGDISSDKPTPPIIPPRW